MNKIKLLAICGSLRKESFNRKVMNYAIKIVKNYNVEVKEFDQNISPLPLYNDDLNIQKEENVLRLKKEIENADIIMIISPEYNHSLPGVLKNVIDWGSKNPNSFNGKTAIIFGASTGIYGTMRMQIHLRQILTALNVYIEPQPQVLIGNVDKIFDSNNNIIDQKISNQIKALIEKTIKNYSERNEKEN